MAAINNNPFEYWITHDDKAYNKLMEDVSAFINDPKDKVIFGTLSISLSVFLPSHFCIWSRIWNLL